MYISDEGDVRHTDESDDGDSGDERILIVRNNDVTDVAIRLTFSVVIISQQ